MPVVVRLVSVCESEVAFVPDHPPLPVQEVALVEDQVKVDELPLVTDVGEAEKVMVGEGLGAVYVVRKFSTLHPSGVLS